MPVEITAAQLRQAADLIDSPSRWTKGAEARDARGALVPALADTAIRWCALGALCRVTNQHRWNVSAALNALEPLQLVTINDHGGRCAAIAALRYLTNLAEAREKGTANA